MKKLLAILLCLIMVLSLAACGTKQGPVAEVATEEPVVEETTAADPKQVETQVETKVAPKDPNAGPVTVGPVADKSGPSASGLELIAGTPELLHPLLTSVGGGAQRSDNVLVYSTRYPQISLPQEEANKYPNLATALTEDLNNYCYLSTLEGRDLILEGMDASMLDDPYFGGYYFNTTAAIQRADDNFFSVKLDTTAYTGGQHGDSFTKGFTYTTQDGKLITPADIFTSKEELLAVLEEKLNEFEDVEYFSLASDLANYSFETSYMADKTAFNFVLTADSVVFYFDPYELAPYAYGQQIVSLPYSEYADIIKPGIAVAPVSYITKLEMYTPNVTPSGTITISATYGEADVIHQLKFTVSGKDYSFDTFSYTVDPYMVQRGSKTFLYVFQSADDDEDFYQVFSVEKGEVKNLGRYVDRLAITSEALEPDAVEGYNCYARANTVTAFCDPDSIIFESGTYKVGKDGRPEAK